VFSPVIWRFLFLIFVVYRYPKKSAIAGTAKETPYCIMGWIIVGEKTQLTTCFLNIEYGTC